MKKTDKKLEKQLITVLTTLCEQFKTSIDGFIWLTHTVNMKHFNDSLRISCIFETNQQLLVAKNNQNVEQMKKQIAAALSTLNISSKLKNEKVFFDSEENRQLSHSGDWQSRLALRPH